MPRLYRRRLCNIGSSQALQREVSRLMFSSDGQELNIPTVALARLHDLTTALSMIRNYVNVCIAKASFEPRGATLSPAEWRRLGSRRLGHPIRPK